MTELAISPTTIVIEEAPVASCDTTEKEVSAEVITSAICALGEAATAVAPIDNGRTNGCAAEMSDEERKGYWGCGYQGTSCTKSISPGSGILGGGECIK